MSARNATTEARDASHAVEEALEDVRLGRPVALVDDVRRAAEGTLTVASDFVTAETIAFLATHGRGLICLCLTAERCEELGLEPMTHRNGSSFKTDFRISIEARKGVSTGISAADRARTIQVAADPTTGPSDIVSPGHVFPLRAQRGGVLRRPGRTEAAVDLARLAGLTPAAIVCELLNADGTAARGPEVASWCERHGLRHLALSDLIEYRRCRERLVERLASSQLPTAYGEFVAIAYRETLTDLRHLALVRGNVNGVPGVVVSVHVACPTGDVFHSLRCDCSAQLESALHHIATEERGVLLYLRRNSLGSALGQAGDSESVGRFADDESCGSLSAGEGAEGEVGYLTYQILSAFGLSEIELLNPNPELRASASRYGLTVSETMPVALAVAIAG